VAWAFGVAAVLAAAAIVNWTNDTGHDLAWLELNNGDNH